MPASAIALDTTISVSSSAVVPRPLRRLSGSPASPPRAGDSRCRPSALRTTAPATRRARCARRAHAGRRCSPPPPIRSPARSARAPSPAAHRAGATVRAVRRTMSVRWRVAHARANRRAHARAIVVRVRRQRGASCRAHRGTSGTPAGTCRSPSAATSARRSTHSIVCPSAKVSNRISSLLKKPASGRTPAIASDADQERPVRDRQLLPEAAHVADVLLAVQRVNDRAGPEEQAAP